MYSWVCSKTSETRWSLNQLSMDEFMDLVEKLTFDQYIEEQWNKTQHEQDKLEQRLRKFKGAQ